MRQGAPETPPSFRKGRGVECPLACQPQILDYSPAVGEQPCFEEMVCEVASTLVEGMRIKPLDRLGDADVQSLLAWDCDAGEERLTHKFMAEGEGPLWPFGTGDDDSHLLGFLDDDEKLVHVDLADLAQQLKTETAPDHRRRCQHPLLVLLEPI